MPKFNIKEKDIGKYAGQLIDAIRLSDDGVIKATKYISEHLTIKATRKIFGGKIDKRDRIAEFVVTFGKPNYQERKFINKLKKAKEPFPVKKIQLKYLKG